MEILTPEWITAISTIILVIVTSIYVIFAGKLTKETIKLREVETNPYIYMYFKPSYIGARMKLVIKNIGKGSSHNISFKINEKYKKYFRYDFSTKISYFSPNQEIISLSDYYHKLEEIDTVNIPIIIEYYSKDNKKIVDNFILEWKHLSATLINADHSEGTKIALETIAKELVVYNKNIAK